MALGDSDVLQGRAEEEGVAVSVVEGARAQVRSGRPEHWRAEPAATLERGVCCDTELQEREV